MTAHNPSNCLTCRTVKCASCRVVFTKGGFSDAASCPDCLRAERNQAPGGGLVHRRR